MKAKSVRINDLYRHFMSVDVTLTCVSTLNSRLPHISYMYLLICFMYICFGLCRYISRIVLMALTRKTIRNKYITVILIKKISTIQLSTVIKGRQHKSQSLNGRYYKYYETNQLMKGKVIVLSKNVLPFLQSSACHRPFKCHRHHSSIFHFHS